MRANALLGSLLAAVLTLAGCSGQPPEPGIESGHAVEATRTPARSSQQALRIDDDSGGVSIHRPRGTRAWWGTFGGRLACAKSPVRITKIRPEWTVAPLRAKFLIRTVDRSPGDARGVSDIIYSKLGQAPRFAESYARKGRKPGGQFVPAEGAMIEGPCDLADEYQEFLVSVRSGQRGVDLKQIDVEYSSEENSGVLKLRRWRIVACGTGIDTRRRCRRS